MPCCRRSCSIDAARLVAAQPIARLAVPGSASAAADDGAQLNRVCHMAAAVPGSARGETAYATALLAMLLLESDIDVRVDPVPARNDDILPANNRLKHASPTDFLLASASAYASGGGWSEVAPRCCRAPT